MTDYVEFHPFQPKLTKSKHWLIWNIVYDQYIGEIRKERAGTWMHWKLFLYPDCGCSNGCLKQISKFITTLYSKK